MARKKLALFSALTLSVFVLSSFAVAEGTLTWEQSKFDDLIKGTAHGSCLPERRRARTCPRISRRWRLVHRPTSGRSRRTLRATSTWLPEPLLVSIASRPTERSTTIFEPQELQVQTLVVTRAGSFTQRPLRTARSTNRHTAKSSAASEAAADKADATKASDASSTTSSWSAAVYLRSRRKYIWDLALDATGNLYVATGDHGEDLASERKGRALSVFQERRSPYSRAGARSPRAI